MIKGRRRARQRRHTDDVYIVQDKPETMDTSSTIVARDRPLTVLSRVSCLSLRSMDSGTGCCEESQRERDQPSACASDLKRESEALGSDRYVQSPNNREQVRKPESGTVLYQRQRTQSRMCVCVDSSAGGRLKNQRCN